jgi:xanthine dehydrogenase accessory factor
MHPIILIRGGGDLASGVALRLHRSGFKVIITELPQPLAVRRAVSFSEAVYEERWKVESVTAALAKSLEQVGDILAQNEIPVLVDPDLHLLASFHISLSTIIDARLLKNSPPPLIPFSPFTIGLGPGFVAGENCHAVIETNRGHTLGRAYWTGSANADTGQPEGDPRRVLRAPANGILTGHVEIGDHLESGQLIAEVSDKGIVAPFPGVLRGLIHPGIEVTKNVKIGDVDPRDNQEYCFLVSDKALAVGGGVLEAILAKQPSFPVSPQIEEQI